MRICVVGAGAIGGLLAAQLAEAGHDITVIARGAHLQAMQENGLKLLYQDGRALQAQVRATGSIAEAGRHELVLLALKAHQLGAVADQLPLLFEASTPVVTLQNGIPFWYFQRHGGPHEGRILESVDPGGRISKHIDPGRIIHSVVYPAAEVAAPGVIHHHHGDRFPVGELDNTESARVSEISSLLAGAKFHAPVLHDTRGEVWLKLLGNVSFNPLSALTHASIIAFLSFPLSRALVQRMMEEASAVAQALGIQIRLPIERRIAGAEKLGEHKMSMLQDVEAGRELETDALVGAVAEIARIVNVPTPSVDALHAAVKLLEHMMRRHRAKVLLVPENR